MITFCCNVAVFYCEKGFSCNCKECGKTLAKGHYVIGLQFAVPSIVPEEGWCLLGRDSPVFCCGEQRLVFVALNSKPDAQQRQQEIIDYLNKNHKTDGLKLYRLPGRLEHQSLA